MFCKLSSAQTYTVNGGQPCRCGLGTRDSTLINRGHGSIEEFKKDGKIDEDRSSGASSALPHCQFAVEEGPLVNISKEGKTEEGGVGGGYSMISDSSGGVCGDKIIAMGIYPPHGCYKLLFTYRRQKKYCGHD